MNRKIINCAKIENILYFLGKELKAEQFLDKFCFAYPDKSLLTEKFFIRLPARSDNLN